MACLQLDDNRKIWITRSELSESGWHENTSVDRKTFNHFILLHQYPRALNQAVKLLSGRPCSKTEISRNLKHHHFAEEVISLVIYKLEKEKILDDQEFSRLWISHRIEKYGPRRIRQELRNKGIPDAVSDSSFSRLNEEDELVHATAIARKTLLKIDPAEDPWKKKQKTVSALVRKGFSWNTAVQAYKAAESDED